MSKDLREGLREELREATQDGLRKEIARLRTTNDLLVQDLNLSKTALAETMKLFNNQPNDSGLRDHFAGLAMQSLYLSNTKWEATGERDEESVALIKELACDAYHLADAMIAEREKNG